MDFQIRRALSPDVHPAIELAYRVFMEYEAPLYTADAISKFVDGCVRNEAYIDNYLSGRHMMYVACDSGRIIGMVSERGGGRISMLFVDGAYHRRGIATALMDNIIKSMREQGEGRITLHSSPYGAPFYLKYGFMPSVDEQNIDGFIVTPMFLDAK